MTLLSPTPVAEERAAENILRPRYLSQFPGQDQIKQLLTISIEAAKRWDAPVPHMLFAGPPGLGKTTLAGIVANEIGTHVHVTAAPAIRRSEELVSLLTSVEPMGVVFIDEIHRLAIPVEESLYAAMEDGVVDVILGKGPSARPMRFQLPKLTIIGATTRMGQISEPLRDRFGSIHRLEPYSIPVLSQIVVTNGAKLGSHFGMAAGEDIAKRARGTPRIANRLLQAAREYAEVFRNGTIDEVGLTAMWKMLGLDENGVDERERTLLRVLSVQPTPVGVNTLATLLDESSSTIEDVMEPNLLQLGYMARTPRGRIITDAGRRYVG